MIVYGSSVGHGFWVITGTVSVNDLLLPSDQLPEVEDSVAGKEG